jgi:formyltetrahydrofolate-dependent phosphoribosylglycinamide formyltransferase
MNYAILASGRGSNADALLTHSSQPGSLTTCAGVVCNVEGAGVLEVAARHRVPQVVVRSPRRHGTEALDRKLLEALEAWDPQLIVLAGFMRIVGPTFLAAFPNRVLNIHPSLLPSFPGLRTHAAALRSGVSIHGCTVHLVTERLDDGPILAQGAVPVRPADRPETLAARVLQVEHQLYASVLHQIATGDIDLSGSGATFSAAARRALWEGEVDR